MHYCIDKELLIFKLKKMKLHELCPDVTLNLQGYVNQLEKTRARLVKQKMMLAKQNDNKVELENSANSCVLQELLYS